MKGWMKWLAAVIIGSVVVHVVAIWAAPRLIMGVVFERTTAAANGANVFLHAPRPSAASRAVVRPSPDLLYSICIADLGGGPIRVSVPVSEPYTSVSVFADNTDNVFALNDRETGGRPIEVVLARENQEVAGGTPVVRLPSDRAVVLVRRIIENDAHLARLEPIRQQDRCR
jgi:uncharacterized membrane protein